MLYNLFDQEVAPELRFWPANRNLMGSTSWFPLYVIFAKLQLDTTMDGSFADGDISLLVTIRNEKPQHKRLSIDKTFERLAIEPPQTVSNEIAKVSQAETNEFTRIVTQFISKSNHSGRPYSYSGYWKLKNDSQNIITLRFDIKSNEPNPAEYRKQGDRYLPIFHRVIDSMEFFSPNPCTQT